MAINNKKGFTLLEIIVVIIILGVLAGLALPRLFSNVEFSRSAEALNSISILRQSIQRCALMRSDDYTNCDDFVNLDVDDPGTAPGAHFTYAITIQDNIAGYYTIQADRIAGVDGGTNGDYVRLVLAAGGATRSGFGAFLGLQ